MTLHVLEKLAATNPDCEIWWDSSPLVYQDWAQATLASAPAEKRDVWAEQLQRLLDPETIAQDGTMGFRGVTTNPPLSLQALQNDPQYWRAEIQRIAKDYPRGDVQGVYWATYLQVVRKSAEMVLPVFRKSGAKYGYVSGQVDPRYVRDGERMLREGLQIAAQGENVMVKIPGSKEGYEVIEELTARGIATNNTTSFTVSQYQRCMDAVSKGLARARASGVSLDRWRSVVTHMSSRLGTIGDLEAEAAMRDLAFTPAEIQQGEMAVLKRAYEFGRTNNYPSKMLQCSMRVHEDPETGKASSWHIQKIAGGDFVYTCPPTYIAKLMEVEDRLDDFDANAIDEQPPAELIERLRRLPYFRKAYDFDAMEPEEFVEFGAFAATATEFAKATRKTVDFVTAAMEH
ncbi:transaldolase family protein [Aurantiacibacter gangjinensis]|uniref:Uncharacterized protein n=1 Tax=Aurantiacibacter gangjinensis TaxID=502682 RepID=A0A0G9MPT1_9SPHN|nr:transaldolase family protein [Aurantiacibacter gangjinensis]APE27170.1 Transaldolase [Aurantiacibacter gangjinensis]KLE31308.1 hypothetical protein AAW01_06725 [Aurantiacibacter gangjinensis]